MEALIMSCSTGGGHNAAARAVAEELKRRGYRTTLLDPYQLAGKHTAKIVGSGYVRLVQRSPETFGVVYALGEAYRRLPIHSPVYAANKKMAGCMREFLSEHHFDIILMTHMYPAHILTNLREQGFPLPKTVLIATDYTCIPFMEEAVCDHYIIPAESLRQEFASKGIPADRIEPLGIPVRRAFLEPLNKSEACQRLNLDEEKQYLLLSGGSIGAGNIKKTVQALKKYLETDQKRMLLIICGNNQKLYRTLRRRYRRNAQIMLMKSTAQMPDYMKACDIFISKPGGLSSTEAAAAQIPLIHISPIPGCESRNVRFFQEHGMSLYVKNPRREITGALKLLEAESRVKQMRGAQSTGIPQNSVIRIGDFIDSVLKHS